MPHFVFANNNEIAARSADGASLACQPDVCFSPGAPMPGVPVPYANSVFARDLDNLSRTVLIKGTGAALEDKSYFSTSYGDEPATSGMMKGIISGKIKGKAYFKSWSMDVKIEGRGVARHLDTVTHNHVNQANALAQKYRSIWEKADGCSEDRDAVRKNCPPKQDDKDKDKDKDSKPKRKSLLQKAKNLASVPDETAKKALGYKRSAGNGWVDDYCDGLWIKPSNGKKAFEEAKAEIEQFINQDKWTLARNAFNELMGLAKEKLGVWYVIETTGSFALRSVGKEALAGILAPTVIGSIGSAALTAWTITDAIATAEEIARALGPQGLAILSDLKSAAEIEKLLEAKLQQWKDDPLSFMTEAMTTVANTDTCIRARRCMLVPYNKTASPARAARSGEGCCPGQTGHHVMPGAMFGSSGIKIDPAFANACGETRYNHRNAPTICLEGTDNTHGSHGLAHRSLRTEIDTYKNQTRKDRMSYREAREAALDAVKRVAPQCSRACLRAQLDVYYKDCDKDKEENLKATSGDNGATTPSEDSPDPENID